MTETAAGDAKICVLGLGYVGLPLAVAFAKQGPVVGIDVSEHRVAELRAGVDETREVSAEDLTAATGLEVTSRIEDASDCGVYIVTVPTPLDAHRQPDLGPLRSACDMVGRVLRAGDLVIFESTVYPGATEEDCVPILEAVSGLRFNHDFTVGYSPERINPGDTSRRLETILKVTSGSTPEAADTVDALYRRIVTAGTYQASSIRVAEAAKVIENTQRDLNIALINELAIVFERLGLDTQEVLAAAATKWNFLPFKPGLVGGHCIGVDPYYLTHKAAAVGYHPEVILAGRRLNDGMGRFIAGQLVKAMIRKKIDVAAARVLVMGFTFKEDCPDTRNTRIIDVVRDLASYGMRVDVHDPIADGVRAREEYDVELVTTPEPGVYDGVVMAVAHRPFVALGPKGVRAFAKPTHVFYDVKAAFDIGDSDLRL